MDRKILNGYFTAGFVQIGPRAEASKVIQRQRSDTIPYCLLFCQNGPVQAPLSHHHMEGTTGMHVSTANHGTVYNRCIHCIFLFLSTRNQG